VADLPLVRQGRIEKRHLYTLRKGEAVRDNVSGGVSVIPQEMIKVREGAEKACILYDGRERACTIYEHRPAQCAALKCWDTGGFMEVYRGPRLERKDLVEDEILMGLIDGHERRCSYEALEGQVKKIAAQGERAVEGVLRILRFDFELRSMVVERLGMLPEERDFFFGRPLVETVGMFGLKVVKEPDGSFLLTKA